MGKARIILDTNVIISAFGWPGKPREIFERVVNGDFDLIISENQLNEIRRVLTYPKLRFNEFQRRWLLDILKSVATVVQTQGHLNIIKEDPSDNMFLEAAIENEVNFIITGDHHILRLGNFKGIKILTPAKFLPYRKRGQYIKV